MILKLICLIRGHRMTDRREVHTLTDGTGYLRLYGQCSRCQEPGLYTGRNAVREEDA